MATSNVDLTKMTTAQLLEYIAKVEAEKAAAEKRAEEQASYSVKIGRSGTASVTGFGRYGVSLYPNQWRILAKLVGSIVAFCDANEAALTERAANPLGEGVENPSKAFKLKMAA